MNDFLGFRIFDKKKKIRCTPDHSFWIDPSGTLWIGTSATADANRYVIERCTGFRDMDGKLVYEGDVLRDRDNRHPHIYFSRGYGRFMLDYGDDEDGPVPATMSNIADMSAQFSINTPKR